MVQRAGTREGGEIFEFGTGSRYLGGRDGL